MGGLRKSNKTDALHTAILQGKCPYAEHMNNLQKKSYKELEETLGLEHTKEELTQATRLLYASLKDHIEYKDSIESTISYLNTVLNSDQTMVAEIDKIFGGNEKVTDKVVAGFGTAVRTILLLRDVYLALGGDPTQTSQAIRKMVYQLASVSVRDFALTNQRLKEDSDVLSIKNRDYSPENFDIDDQGTLIVKPGIVDEMRKGGRCPVVGMKSQEAGDIIIDDMIQRLLQ